MVRQVVPESFLNGFKLRPKKQQYLILYTMDALATTSIIYINLEKFKIAPKEYYGCIRHHQHYIYINLEKFKFAFKRLRLLNKSSNVTK